MLTCGPPPEWTLFPSGGKKQNPLQVTWLPSGGERLHKQVAAVSHSPSRKKLTPALPGCYFSCFNLNTLRPRQNGRLFPENILKRIFMNENVWISIKMSLKFALKGPINNIPALVQIMAWHRPGDKPLSEPMMIILLTHICVTLPQWVNIRQWN